MFTAVSALAVSVGPGLLIGFAVPPGRGRWIAWSGAPALTLGVVAVGLSWLGPLGLPRSAAAILVGEVMLAGVAVVGAWWWANHRKQAAGWWRIRPGAPRVFDAVAVTIVAGVTAGFGWSFFGGFDQPPGWDAMYHGMLSREILQHGSTAVSAVCRTGSTASSQACQFTPLGLDVSWAQAAQLSSGHIGTAMLTWEALLGPIATVVAVYVLLRVLGALPLVSASAAVLINVVGPLWMSSATGRITQQVTPGLAVAAVLFLAVAVRGHHRARFVALAGLAAAGVLLAHTYEILFVGVFAATVLAFGWPSLRRRAAATARLAGGAALVAVLAVAPSISALLAADKERTTAAPPFAGDLAGAFRFWVTDPRRYVPFGFPSPSALDPGTVTVAGRIAQAGTMACLLACVLCVVWAELRWARPWLASWAVFTAAGIWTSSSNSAPARAVAGLWYGVPDRLRSLLMPAYAVLTVAGAVAIALAVRRLVASRSVARRPQRRTVLAGVAAAAVAAVLLGCAALPATRRPLATDLASRTPHGPSYARVSDWLAEHLPSSGVVAYDQNLDMITWSYVDRRVGFLFGEPPVAGAQATDYDLRWQVWNWLVDNPGAVPSGCLVNRYRVQFVVIAQPWVPNFPAHYELARVAASPRLDLVHVDGKIKIYQVNAAGRACATTPPG